MRLSRMEIENCLCFRERLVVDLGRRTIIRGANAAGKSSFLRCVATLLGASGESAASLVSTDEKGVPLEGVVPEIVGIVDGDGARYKITRRAKKLEVKIDENGAWRDAPGGSPDQALARIFDRDSSPAALLDERLSEDKRVGLVLEVADAVNYDRERCLDAALNRGGTLEAFPVRPKMSFDLQPIPAGLHPLEDLARVQKQVFDVRTDVERQRKAAASAAERLSTGLSAEPPKDVADQIERAEAALKGQRETISQLDLKLEIDVAGHEKEFQAQVKALRLEFDHKIADARLEHGDAARDSQMQLVTATRELAELRGQREVAVADKARRDEAEKARSEAEALGARHAALTKAINSLKAQAARFVSDSFPGVTVEVGDDGKRRIMVQAADGAWRPWSSSNEGRLMEIAAAWSVRHQATRGGAAGPSLALGLLDRGAELDVAAIQRLTESGQWIVAVHTEGELEFEAL